MEYEERKTMEGNRELVKRNRNQIQVLLSILYQTCKQSPVIPAVSRAVFT